MQTAEKPSIRKTWANAIVPPASEFPLTPLPVLSGQIPEGLQGSLYRNGPGRLERGGKRAGHWFDGDGAILAVHFTPHEVTGIYRFVQTAGYQAETTANRYLYPNYGMTTPGAIWQHWGKPVKNSANTSVLALPNQLLALWEGGNPYALDLQTLETWGTEDLGQLKDDLPYSAHPKIDPKTGDIFNFGVSPGLNAQLNLYRSDATGKIIQKSSIQLEGVPLIHDFVMAGHYLIFFISPVYLNLLPTGLGLKSFSEALEWKPQKGTQILVINRESLSLVSRGETEAWFQWHFANGFIDRQGSVIVDLVRYNDFQTNERLRQISTGQLNSVVEGMLWRVILSPQTGQVKKVQQLLERGCEFPVVPAENLGQDSRYIYLSAHREGVNVREEVYGAIGRFDTQTDQFAIADLGENRYPTEPIFVASPQDSEQGWVLTVVYDGNTHTSEVWIYDSEGLDREPICRLGLPSVVPMGFHGTWKSAL